MGQAMTCDTDDAKLSTPFGSCGCLHSRCGCFGKKEAAEARVLCETCHSCLVERLATREQAGRCLLRNGAGACNRRLMHAAVRMQSQQVPPTASICSLAHCCGVAACGIMQTNLQDGH